MLRQNFDRIREWAQGLTTKIEKTYVALPTASTPPAPPVPGFGIPPNEIFVAIDGDNSNDGLSWATAKKTADQGYLALMALGGGTLTVQSGSWSSITPQAGLWVSGPNDVGTWPSPWVRGAAAWELNMVPADGAEDNFSQGTLSPGGGASTFNGPMLQVAGYENGFIGSNLNADVSSSAIPGMYFPAIRLGLSSPLANYDAGTTYDFRAFVLGSDGKSYGSLIAGNIGHDPTSSPAWWVRARRDVGDYQGNTLGTSLTANIVWDNVNAVTAGTDGGPAYDLGYTFQVWYYSFTSILRSIGGGTDPALNCSARAIAGGTDAINLSSNYLQFFDNRCRVNGGGWYWEGSGGINGVFQNVDGLFGENMVMAAVHLAPGVGGGPGGVFANVSSADSPDATSIRNMGGTLISTTNCPYVVGPAVNFDVQTQGQPGHNPLAFGQVGISGPSLKMQVDSPRRLFAPVTGRYPNIAAPATAIWQPSSSPVTGPSGLAGSALQVAADTFLFLQGYNFFGAINVGDWFAVDVWVLFPGAPFPGGFIITNTGSADMAIDVYSPGCGEPISKTMAAGGDPYTWPGGQPVAQGQWIRMWCYFQITSFAAGATLGIRVPAGVSMASPWVIHVPVADGVPIEEIGEMALASSGSPNAGGTPAISPPLAPIPGNPALAPGSGIEFWDGAAWRLFAVNDGQITIDGVPYGFRETFSGVPIWGNDGEDGADAWIPGLRGLDGLQGRPGAPGGDGEDGQDGLTVPGSAGPAGIVWPAATQILVSQGTSSVPVGDSTFTFDTMGHVLAAGNAVGINGVSMPTNASLVVGHTTNANRDRVQVFVGGGTLGGGGTSDSTLFDLNPTATVITAGVTGGIYATQRIRQITYSGSGTSPAELTSLYIDGAPNVGGGISVGTNAALHVAAGQTKLGGPLTCFTLSAGGAVAADTTGTVGIAGVGGLPAAVSGEQHYYVNVLGSSLVTGGADWLGTSSTAGQGSTALEYEHNFAASNVALKVRIITNAITVGTLAVQITRNGATFSSLTLNSTSSGTMSTGTVSVGSPTASDRWGVLVTGVGTTMVGNMIFTATLLVAPNVF